MVIYEREPGAPEYHRADDLTAAIAEVERLRNADGIEAASIFELQEVTFQFEPYFRVTLEEGADDGSFDGMEDGMEDGMALTTVVPSTMGDEHPVVPIDLREDDVTFTTFPAGRRLFSR
jgi:hypothetical protein